MATASEAKWGLWRDFSRRYIDREHTYTFEEQFVKANVLR